MTPASGQGHGEGFLSPAAQTRQRRQTRSEKHDTVTTDANRNESETSIFAASTYVPEFL